MKNKKGFTLIELMIVVAIIGLFLFMIIGKLQEIRLQNPIKIISIN